MHTGETMATGPEQTLRGICGENASKARELKAKLESALGASSPEPGGDDKVAAVNVIDQALDLARATGGMLDAIEDLVRAGILNRI